MNAGASLLVLLLALSSSAEWANAQTSEPDLSWFSVAGGGGGGGSANGSIGLAGVIGQPAAGRIGDSTLAIEGGFGVIGFSMNYPPVTAEDTTYTFTVANFPVADSLDSVVTTTLGTLDPIGGIVTSRFVVGNNLNGLIFNAADAEYGANLFYSIGHDMAGHSVFTSLSTLTPATEGTTDHFSLGARSYDALTYAAPAIGIAGPISFYYLRHESAGATFFGYIHAPSGGFYADFFSESIGSNLGGLTFAAPDAANVGANLFYYLRQDQDGHSWFGSIDPGAASGVAAAHDLYDLGVDLNFDTLAFVEPDLAGAGPNLFYYLRHDGNGDAWFGSINPRAGFAGARAVDRFRLPGHRRYHGLAFTTTAVGYGPDLFYFLQSVSESNAFVAVKIATLPSLGSLRLDGVAVAVDQFVSAADINAGKLTFVPAANVNGTDRFTFRVNDGQVDSSLATVSITINPANDAPTLAALSNLTINQNAGTQTVNLGGISAGPANESGQTVTITATSSQSAIIPNPTVSYTGGATGTLALTLAAHSNTAASGPVTITATATDDATAGGTALSFSRTFTVTVTPVNDSPTVSQIANSAINEDNIFSAGLTVADSETAAENLTVTATSSNQTLVPDANILLGGSGSNRSLAVVPVANQSGTTTITVAVKDAALATTTTSFALTVNPVNDPPTLDPLPNFILKAGAVPTTLIVALTGITAGASNETQPLTITAVSSSPTVVSLPLQSITVSSPATTANLALAPNANAAAGDKATITVTVSDGESPGHGAVVSRSFDVEVTDRSVRVASRSGVPGIVVSVPIELVSSGVENAVSASVRFDATILSFVDVVPGAGAVEASGEIGPHLNVNRQLLDQGVIGVAVALPADKTFASGTQSVLVLNFRVLDQVAAMTANSTSLVLQDTPMPREVADATMHALAAVYENAEFVIHRGFEGDIMDNRPFGDGIIKASDWTQVGLFMARLDAVNSAGEFQRADCAPRAVDGVLKLGDGLITLGDWVQAGRYAAGMDSWSSADGPFASVELQGLSSARPTLVTKSLNSSGRAVWMQAGGTAGDQTLSVQVMLNSPGGENAIAFSVQFDAQALRFVNARVGEGAGRAILLTNARNLENGRAGFALTLPPGQSLDAGTSEVLALQFSATATATEAGLGLVFDDFPIPREFVSVTAGNLLGNFENGLISVPTPPQEFKRGSTLQLLGRTPDGNAQLRLSGQPGDACRIEVSSDLIHWTPLMTVTLTNRSSPLVDSEARNWASRYYRVGPGLIVAP